MKKSNLVSPHPEFSPFFLEPQWVQYKNCSHCLMHRSRHPTLQGCDSIAVRSAYIYLASPPPPVTKTNEQGRRHMPTTPPLRTASNHKSALAKTRTLSGLDTRHTGESNRDASMTHHHDHHHHLPPSLANSWLAALCAG